MRQIVDHRYTYYLPVLPDRHSLPVLPAWLLPYAYDKK
jgi:hypothetical protein